jgi:hypothetical protein
VRRALECRTTRREPHEAANAGAEAVGRQVPLVEPSSSPIAPNGNREQAENTGPGLLDRDVPIDEMIESLEHETEAILDQVERRLARLDRRLAPADPQLEIRILDDLEIESEPDPEWRIDGILPTDTLGVLYGPSEGGKSFLVLDWALSVASGRTSLGRSVQRAPVVYIAAEGWGGIKRRVRAWKEARGVAGRVGVYFFSGNVNVMERGDVGRLLIAIREKIGGDPGFIIFDTLNQSMPGGDENASKDMGLAIANAQELRRTTHATVLLVHHCRRQDEQERGHGSLRNAADTMMSLTVDDNDARVLTCTKQRNAGYFDPIRFSLVQQDDSLVVADPPISGPGPGQPLTKSQEQALKVLRDLAVDDAGVPYSRWEDASGLKERTFAVAVKGLIDAGRAVRHGKGKGTRYQPAEHVRGDDSVPF